MLFIEGVEYHQSDAENIYYKLGMEFPEWEDDTIHSYWWGGNLMGVAENPINLGSNQDKLVYSPHDYVLTIRPGNMKCRMFYYRVVYFNKIKSKIA